MWQGKVLTVTYVGVAPDLFSQGGKSRDLLFCKHSIILCMYRKHLHMR